MIHQVLRLDSPGDSHQNMEIDKAHFLLTRTLSAQEYLIRLYEWKRPCISLGISQDESILREDRRDDVDVVRRITGGLAVYHYREITYSIAAPVDSLFFGGSLYESYQKIAIVLFAFLESLGLAPTFSKQKSSFFRAGQRSAVCFQYMGYYELSVGGQKVIGSAQKRDHKGFLQHGSIPIYPTEHCLEDYLKDEYQPRHRARSVLLSLLDANKRSMDDYKALLKQTFQSYLRERS